MPSNYMLRKHLRSKEIAARPENQRLRAIEIEANNRGAADREAKFPTVTQDNFSQVNEYQIQRIAYWKAKLEN